MEKIPILQLGEILLVTIQVELHDELAVTLQNDLTTKLSKTSARGVLLDISALEIVDSFIGRSLAQIASMARVMDSTMVLVGMRPAVAITLVELGMTLSNIKTALNVENGMRLLHQALAEPGDPLSRG